MNKGLKKEQRYSQHTIGSAGITYINLNKNNANMHITVPLIGDLSLIYNLQEKNIDTEFGKGFRLSYYNKLTYNSISDTYSIEQADGTIYEFIKKENSVVNPYTYEKNGSIVRGFYDYYYSDELGQILVVKSENNMIISYEVLKPDDTLIRYRINDNYPLIIEYKSGERVEFESYAVELENNQSMNMLRRIHFYKCDGTKVSEIECTDFSDLIIGSILVKSYENFKIRIDINYDNNNVLNKVEYYKYSDDGVCTQFQDNYYTFANNSIIIKDGIKNYSNEYQIHSTGVGEISKVTEKINDKVYNEIDITFRDHFTKVKNKDSSYVAINFNQDNLPICEIDNNKMAISYKYDENNKLKYITKPICLEPEEGRYNNIYDLDKEKIYNHVSEINNVSNYHLGDKVLKFEKGYESTYIATLDYSGLANDNYALAFSYRMDCAPYNGTFKVKIYEVNEGTNGITEELEIYEEILPKPNLPIIIDGVWFYIMIPFTSKNNFKKIKFEFIYNDTNVNGYIGGIKLLKINHNLEESKLVSQNVLQYNNILYMYEYNNKNQVTKVTTSLGSSVEYSYDSLGNIIQEKINQNNGTSDIVQYEYNDENKLERVTDGLNREIGYGYTKYNVEIEISGSDEVPFRIFTIITYMGTRFRRCKYLYDKFDNLRSIEINESNNPEYYYNRIDYNADNSVDKYQYIEKEPYKISYDEDGRIKSIGCGIDDAHNTILEDYKYYDKLLSNGQLFKTNLLSEIMYSGDDLYTYKYDDKYNLECIKYYNNKTIASLDDENISENLDQQSEYDRYKFTYYNDGLLKKATSFQDMGVYSDVEYKYDSNNLLTNMKYIKQDTENQSVICEVKYDYDEKNRLTTKKYCIGDEERIVYYQDYRKKALLKLESSELINGILSNLDYIKLDFSNNPKNEHSFNKENVNLDKNSRINYVENGGCLIDEQMEIISKEFKETITFLYKPIIENPNERFVFLIKENPSESPYTSMNWGVVLDNQNYAYFYADYKIPTSDNINKTKIPLNCRINNKTWNFIGITYSGVEKQNAKSMQKFCVYINDKYNEINFDETIFRLSDGTEEQLSRVSFALEYGYRCIDRQNQQEGNNSGQVAEVTLIKNKELTKEELQKMSNAYLILSHCGYVDDINDYVTGSVTYDINSLPLGDQTVENTEDTNATIADSSEGNNESDDEKRIFNFIPLFSSKKDIMYNSPVLVEHGCADKIEHYNYFSNNAIDENDNMVTCNQSYGYVINNNCFTYNVGTHASGYVAFRYSVDYLPVGEDKVQICEFRNGKYGSVLFNLFIYKDYIRAVKRVHIIAPDNQENESNEEEIIDVGILNLPVELNQTLDIVITHNQILSEYNNYWKYVFYINGFKVENNIELKDDESVDELYVTLGSNGREINSAGIVELLMYSNEGLALENPIENYILKPDSIKTFTFYDSLGRVSKKQVCKNIAESLSHRYVKCMGDDKVVLETLYEYEHETNLVKTETQKYNDVTYETTYTYDNFNNLISEKTESVIEGTRTIEKSYEYKYDLGDRLKEANNLLTKTKKVYNYNIQGNLRSNIEISNYDQENLKSENTKEYIYNNTYSDLLTNYDDYTIEYGANNSTWLPKKITKENGEIIYYTWEGKNLKQVLYEYPESDGMKISKIISYEYDHAGMRTNKKITDILDTSNTSTSTEYSIDYIYEGTKLLMEIHGAYKLEYLYDEYDYAIGVKFINNIKKETFFYIRDLTGRINKIINEFGEVVGEYKYDSWGKIIEVVNYALLYETKIIMLNSIRYKGYYYDEETQLYWVSSRYYSPELCRWISPDSIEYLDPQSINGLNLYAYCGNDPVMCR